MSWFAGANFIGAIIAQDFLHPDAPVVTVFPDDNKKYLSTDLLRDEPFCENHISNEIKLLGFRAYKRVCYTCCDPAECLDTHSPGALLQSLPACPVRML